MNQKITDRKIAFIKASWHEDIVDQCHASFSTEMIRKCWHKDQIVTFTVPGALEIPLLAKTLAQSKEYACIVASAFVVDGGIYRHDFVAASVVDAMMRVQLETGTPIISAVLTPHQYQETDVHNGFFGLHFKTKGMEAANACDDVVQLYANIAKTTLSQGKQAAA